MTDSAGASFTVRPGPGELRAVDLPEPGQDDIVRMLWTGLIRDPGTDRRGRVASRRAGRSPVIVGFHRALPVAARWLVPVWPRRAAASWLSGQAAL